MNNSIIDLQKLVTGFHPLSDESWNAFKDIWKPFECKRKVIITQAGETERYLYFVTEGVQRVFYLDENDREATLVFTYPPSFGGVLDSMLQHTPAAYSYESLTASVFLRARIEKLEKLAEQYPDIRQWLVSGLSATLAGVLKRLTELQCFPAEERYLNLLKRSPHILNLIPHKYLANYLGMDASSFSKLVNRIRIE